MSSTASRITELTNAGWIQTRSGRWHHANFPGVAGRRRLFTTHDAHALLEASPAAPTAADDEAVTA